MSVLRQHLARLVQARPELLPHVTLLLKAVESDETTPEKKLTDQLVSLGSNGWWKPPYNLAINFALMGANLWTFTVLPLFWQKKSYRQDLGGIVLHPIWTSVGDGRTIGQMDISGFHHLTDAIVNKLVASMKTLPTVEDTVRRELQKVEQHFGINIPDAITAKLATGALATAKRRWKVNRLRVKDTLVPLDGGKPYDL